MNSQQINQLIDILKSNGMVHETELGKALADIRRKTDERLSKGNNVSLSTIIRGLRAKANQPALTPETVEADVRYLETHCRALSTGSTPGSYLVPTIQADDIIQMLALGSVARQVARIWPMSGVQKMTIPSALTSPSWVWSAQTSVTTPTDANLGQISFDLKERRCLVAIPNQLLAVSVPAFDTVLSQIIGLSSGEFEDAAFFGSSQASGGPLNLVGFGGLTTLNAAGNNANGGNLLFTDLTAVLAKSASVKAKPPFCWFMSPRTFYQRVYGMIDTTSRPLFIPTQTQGLQDGAKGTFYVGMLLGWSVYVTPNISEAEAAGSGTNQSHIIFTNGSYLHIADAGTFRWLSLTSSCFLRT